MVKCRYFCRIFNRGPILPVNTVIHIKHMVYVFKPEKNMPVDYSIFSWKLPAP